MFSNNKIKQQVSSNKDTQENPQGIYYTFGAELPENKFLNNDKEYIKQNISKDVILYSLNQDQLWLKTGQPLTRCNRLYLFKNEKDVNRIIQDKKIFPQAVFKVMCLLPESQLKFEEEKFYVGPEECMTGSHYDWTKKSVCIVDRKDVVLLQASLPAFKSQPGTTFKFDVENKAAAEQEEKEVASNQMKLGR